MEVDVSRSGRPLYGRVWLTLDGSGNGQVEVADGAGRVAVGDRLVFEGDDARLRGVVVNLDRGVDGGRIRVRMRGPAGPDVRTRGWAVAAV